MVRALYTAGTGMLTQQKRMEAVMNNLVNVETAGYKRDNLVARSFRDMLISRMNDPNILGQTETVGPLNTGIHIDELYTDYSQGVMEDTGRSADLALTGDGYFVVQTPDGERYTRSGAFAVDGSGVLVTADGHPVLGENGLLYVGSESFDVSPDGTVTVDGQAAGTLRLVSFADNGLLRKQGDNLYYNYEPQNNPEQAFAGTVRQGAVEGSNVDVASELVSMLTLQRSYELNSRMITTVDEMLGKSSEIARL